MTKSMNERKDDVKSRVEWIEDGSPIPHFRHGNKEYYVLNDSLEIEIGGTLYRVKCVYDNESFMGDVLDAITMEQINRASS